MTVMPGVHRSGRKRVSAGFDCFCRTVGCLDRGRRCVCECECFTRVLWGCQRRERGLNVSSRQPRRPRAHLCTDKHSRSPAGPLLSPAADALLLCCHTPGRDGAPRTGLRRLAEGEIIDDTGTAASLLFTSSVRQRSAPPKSIRTETCGPGVCELLVYNRRSAEGEKQRARKLKCGR